MGFDERLIAVRTFDSPAVVGVVKRLEPEVGVRISGAVRGWVALFPDQAGAELEELARRMSEMLSLPVVSAVRRPESFGLRRYDRGALTDALDSRATSESSERRKGDPARWMDIVPRGLTEASVAQAFAAHDQADARPADSEEYLERLWALFDLPQRQDGKTLSGDPNCLQVGLHRYHRVPARRRSLLKRLLGSG